MGEKNVFPNYSIELITEKIFFYVHIGAHIHRMINSSRSS